ncbi:MAG: hypothetical protein QOC82_2578 [Frankiaceae bacterium]|jgi:hypothetical protein|nr:hypothetical protein [Frankiaceae bacterium]
MRGAGHDRPVTDAGGGLSKSIRRRIRKRTDGLDIAADINASIAINNGSDGTTTVSRSVQQTAITQSRRKRTPNDAPADSPRTDRSTT